MKSFTFLSQTPSIPTDKGCKTTSSNEKLVADSAATSKDKNQNDALKIATKRGKLIVTTGSPPPPPSSSTEPSSKDEQSKSLHINTKKGKLVVTTTTEGNEKKLQKVVLERLSNEQPTIDSSTNKVKSIESKAENVVAAIDEIKAATETTSNIVTKPTVKARRERVDFNRSSLERNFITPARAMSDFLLKMSDLESLPKTKRRSPYEQEPPIVVYWRKDVEAKAIEVWGSRENLLRECLNREIERKRHQQSKFFCIWWR